MRELDLTSRNASKAKLASCRITGRTVDAKQLQTKALRSASNR
jgi:hypothetical protein